ncbi:hypothetical protein B0A52_02847 [Exophiala mesophila]|uniref:Actin-like ATPase domain-containing protein n=1 Tax=Exophiala mesophila TaxID=212818 RepID=A0A438NDU3_EXOME|nr:hypothetical protein B0A52_02847 [Exophiala mesophila]
MNYSTMADGSTTPPDMVIGVDFGMTQTGEASIHARYWSANVNEIANKVPSRLAYDLRSGQLKSWGFGCDLHDVNLDIAEHFKLYLDPDYKDDYADLTCEESQRWFYDFLRSVHAHVANHFRLRIPGWSNMRVEWVFSVPTTWRNAAFIHSLEALIRSTGFGTDGPMHSCQITLTEAEAAGIAVARQHLDRNDIILVCDAGGGTTDVNILKLASQRGMPLVLEPLSKSEGKPIGSALIDIRIQQYIERYLQNIASRLLPNTPADVAEQMMIGRFERFKCSFGAPGTNIPYLLLDVPGFPPGVEEAKANIFNSQFQITSEVLKNAFDEQVDALVNFVHGQIKELHDRRPGEKVSYIILSGGLGSSPYVQQRLRSHFSGQATSGPQASFGINILAAEEPQLAVVHGLVLERAQQISHTLSPISNRQARVSYGIVVNQRYNPKLHQGMSYAKDSRDGKNWVMDQIDWLIRQGDHIPPNGFVKRMRAKIDPAALQQPWRARFVMTAHPPPDLPKSLHDRRVVSLCEVYADVSRTRRMTKNAHWYSISQKYELTFLDLLILPGSANLRLEIWNDGRKLSSETDAMRVQWAMQHMNARNIGVQQPLWNGSSYGRQSLSPQPQQHAGWDNRASTIMGIPLQFPPTAPNGFLDAR